MPPRLYPTSMPFANCEQHVRANDSSHNEAAAVLHAGREAALKLGVCLLASSSDASAMHVHCCTSCHIMKSSIPSADQVHEQRVFTAVLPTHMAAPSAGAPIVAFADAGFFQLIVVGMRSRNVFARRAASTAFVPSSWPGGTARGLIVRAGP